MIYLRQKREELGISQQELSSRSGVSQQSISLIEIGARKNPGIETLYRLAKAMGCEVKDIYKLEEEEKA